jgi:hypothetical protein
VRQSGEDHVRLPAGERAALEVIEPEFVFQFLILLLDRPALVRESHEGAQQRRGRQVHQVVFGAVARPPCAFAEQPHLRREPPVAPIVGGGDARRAEARARDRLGAVASPVPRQNQIS